MQVKLGPSFLIPNSQIGTFASVTAFKSMVRTRRDMFDVSAAGPIAGGVTALTLLLVGIALSTYTDDASRVRATPVAATLPGATMHDLPPCRQASICQVTAGHLKPLLMLTPALHHVVQSLLQEARYTDHPTRWLLQAALIPVPAQLFEGSLLLGGLVKAGLGQSALAGANVLVHPLLVAGWCSMVSTALNLLPVGRIDGGRMMQVHCCALCICSHGCNELCFIVAYGNAEKLLRSWALRIV